MADYANTYFSSFFFYLSVSYPCSLGASLACLFVGLSANFRLFFLVSAHACPCAFVWVYCSMCNYTWCVFGTHTLLWFLSKRKISTHIWGDFGNSDKGTVFYKHVAFTQRATIHRITLFSPQQSPIIFSSFWRSGIVSETEISWAVWNSLNSINRFLHKHHDMQLELIRTNWHRNEKCSCCSKEFHATMCGFSFQL